jgi:hypothetical protein
VPHPAGVYILDSAHAQMTRIDPTATSQSKTGGIFGYALTGGLASASIKASIQNASARIHSANPRPFYFFFDRSNPRPRRPRLPGPRARRLSSPLPTSSRS